VDERQINIALEACYDAVIDTASWSDALHRLARSFNAVSCMFYPQHPDQTILNLPASHDFKELLGAFVRDGWWQTDHRADRGWPRANAGGAVVLEHEIVSDEERRNLPAYHELYGRYGVPWWAALSFVASGRYWCMPVLRHAGPGPFTPAEARKLDRVIPHLRRMISISEKLTLDRIVASLDILDCVKVPSLTLDWRGRVLRMNRLAEQLVDEDLRIVNGRLEANHRESNRRLQRLLAAVVALGAQSAFTAHPSACAEAVRIDRRDCRPLVVEAIPASRLFADVLCQARALVFITDLAAPLLTAPEKIAAVLGLTAAEGRLVSHLAGGADLEEAAGQLGISIHTARSQVKSAFAKTDTHKQAELVALASRIGRPRESP
jgi:DNA-binding CsgD family transcriptional regulator